ncbi:hypothetical protein OSB04_un001411, partial [Centaurea solstitialis]
MIAWCSLCATRFICGCRKQRLWRYAFVDSRIRTPMVCKNTPVTCDNTHAALGELYVNGEIVPERQRKVEAFSH